MKVFYQKVAPLPILLFSYSAMIGACVILPIIAAIKQDRVDSYIISITIGLLAVLFFSGNLLEKLKSPEEIRLGQSDLTISTLLGDRLKISYSEILGIRKFCLNGNAVLIHFQHNERRRFFVVDIVELLAENSKKPIAGDFIETVLDRSVNLADFEMGNTLGRFIENPAIWGKEPDRRVLEIAERRCEKAIQK